jgi:hypothetical protein
MSLRVKKNCEAHLNFCFFWGGGDVTRAVYRMVLTFRTVFFLSSGYKMSATVHANIRDRWWFLRKVTSIN